MCGENRYRLKLAIHGVGSSPRVRGKLMTSLPALVPVGLIPACAGKTQLSSKTAWRRWAHPRVCGENSTSGVRITDRTGSSPRVRGKLCTQVLVCRGHRLIPACAGKTNRLLPWCFLTRAHPRVCGENVVIDHGDGHRTGSSPRVRGKLEDARQALQQPRLIPACAGKTCSTRRAV